MIRCGWCGKDTANRDRCTSCGHADPARPWVQRAEPIPETARQAGRPRVTPEDAAHRLGALGPHASDDAIADHFGVDPRTVRHWRQKVSG